MIIAAVAETAAATGLRTGRNTWAEAGGGAIIVQAIHTIDLLQWVMGPVESVFGNIATLTHSVEVEDVAVATIKFRNGALAVIEASTSVYPQLPTRLEIHGEKGSIIIEDTEIKTCGIIGEGDNIDLFGADAESNPTNPRVALLTDFAQAISENREPRVNGQEGRKSLEIVCAIYESARSGKMIKLPGK